MTKPISRKMAVDCLLHTVIGWHGTVPCNICKLPLLPEQDIQFDHIHAHVHGGPHEYANLRPLHAECHRKKTAQDIKALAKVKRIIKGKKPGKKIPSRPFQRRVKNA